MNQDKLNEATKSLEFIKRKLVVLHHSSKDQEMINTLLDCFIEMNHLEFTLEDLSPSQNIPFYKRGRGAI